MDQVSLRSARATLDDGRLFARYLEQAADGIFGHLLGRRAQPILAEAFTAPGHDLSYEHVTFAERAGAVVGMVSGYTAAQHEASSDEPLRRAAGWRYLRMSTIALFVHRLVQFVSSVPAGDFYVQAVAVDGDQRGQGIGSLLIDHIESAARSSGSTRLALDVAADNDGARRLYERLGMAEEAMSPRLLLLPGTRVARMVKRL